MALATLDDLSARGVTLDAAEETVMETFIATASAAIQSAAGASIEQTESTVTVEGSCSTWLDVPGAPVTDVASVSVDGTPVTDYQLSSGRLWRACGWSSGYAPSAVTVTYTQGLPTVPADIVDLTLRLALTGLNAQRASADGSGLGTSNVQQERIGDYFVGYRFDAGLTEMVLPEKLRRQLAARFGGGVAGVRAR